MRALPCQDGPRPTLSPTHIWTAVFALSIAIVVVASPTRPIRRLDLQRRIHHFPRIDDQRVVGTPDAIAHEFKKSRIDHLARLKRKLLIGGTVGNVDHARRNPLVVEGFAQRWRAYPHI